MSKIARRPKQPGANASLKHRIERLEAITSAMVADVEILKQRMDKVEIVKARPETAASVLLEQCPQPELRFEEPQKPETE